ncbi:PH domain-containing protein [Haloprofundus halophilus]|uniref:PH domain-containing protein n=1 Tax=Haloprofundus halophilus TaxID=2283527 RepID=UPI000E4517B2|nr:PH domain-containing protein [Haloprofundus halophilus]
MMRLHPRVRLLWSLRAVVAATVVGALAAVFDRFVLEQGLWLPVAVFLAVLFFGVTVALLRYRYWRYEVRDDSLYLERGVFTRVRTVVPFVRIQHVDSSRSPVERLAGLATTVVYTAGSRGADVTIPGLSASGSDDLQERIKRLAIRAEGDDAV